MPPSPPPPVGGFPKHIPISATEAPAECQTTSLLRLQESKQPLASAAFREHAGAQSREACKTVWEYAAILAQPGTAWHSLAQPGTASLS